MPDSAPIGSTRTAMRVSGALSDWDFQRRRQHQLKVNAVETDTARDRMLLFIFIHLAARIAIYTKDHRVNLPITRDENTFVNFRQ